MKLKWIKLEYSMCSLTLARYDAKWYSEKQIFFISDLFLSKQERTSTWLSRLSVISFPCASKYAHLNATKCTDGLCMAGKDKGRTHGSQKESLTLQSASSMFCTVRYGTVFHLDTIVYRRTIHRNKKKFRQPCCTSIKTIKIL